MSLADAAIRGIAASVAFRASAAPYLLLDLDLRIRAANAAYEIATHHGIDDMAGEPMFDVFPDNPATPEAHSVERLGESFERALTRGDADRMGLQRYDVLTEPGGFVEKNWLPVNLPLRDGDGRIVGILHHVEDVTHLLAATALERDLLTPMVHADSLPWPVRRPGCRPCDATPCNGVLAPTCCSRTPTMRSSECRDGSRSARHERVAMFVR